MSIGPAWALVLQLYWPVLVAVTLLLVVGGTRDLRSPVWPRVTAASTLGTGVLLLLIWTSYAQTGHSYVLGRDVVAVVVVGAAIPLLLGGYVWWRRHDPPENRMLQAFVLAGGLAIVAWFVVLFVHCTSGDCL